jgi:hypothetical protein
MESQKKVTFKDEENEYNIILQEIWNDNYGVFLWPCSLVLSNYIFKERRNLLSKESVIYEVYLFVFTLDWMWNCSTWTTVSSNWSQRCHSLR